MYKYSQFNQREKFHHQMKIVKIERRNVILKSYPNLIELYELDIDIIN
jgi:hypothetical protein